MKCLNPLIKTPKGFAESRKIYKDGSVEFYCKGEIYGIDDVMQFPCRKCFYCQQDRAREWTNRCFFEAQQHDLSCVLTMTYEVSPRSLSKEHIQKFLKRLRKAIEPVKILYLVAGEYGSLTKRPHYHMIIFGWCPDRDDCEVWTRKNGHVYYRCLWLEDVWTYGLITIDLKATPEACAYTVGYTLGKLFQQYPKKVLPPFQLMSRRPAIGLKWLQENMQQVYDYDAVYVQGQKKRPPKYFDRKYKEVCDPFDYECLVEKRMENVNRVFTHQKEYEINLYRSLEKLQKSIDKRNEL